MYATVPNLLCKGTVKPTVRYKWCEHEGVLSRELLFLSCSPQSTMGLQTWFAVHACLRAVAWVVDQERQDIGDTGSKK